MKNIETMKRPQRWQDWLALLIGIWIFITPWLFGFNHEEFSWSPYVMGALLVIFSLWAIGKRKVAAESINLIIGIWVFISPWILGFSHTANAAWIMFVFGAIVVVIEIWGMGITKKTTQKPNDFSTVQSS